MNGPAPRGDRGFTLIETLVAVLIIGIAFVVFVGGMGSAIVASDHHRKQALSQAAIRNFAEAVKAAPFSTLCGTAVNQKYENAFVPMPPTRPLAVQVASASTEHVAPSVTAQLPNSRLLNFFAVDQGVAITTPSPTPKWNFVTAGSVPNRLAIALDEIALVDDGPSSSRKATTPAAVSSVSQSVVVDPDSTGAFTPRGTSTTSASPPASTLTLTTPTGTIANDAMFAQIVVRGADTNVSAPDGWVLLGTSTSGGIKSSLYERTASSTSATTANVWTLNPAQEVAGGLISYGGVSRAFTAKVQSVTVIDPATGNAIACDASHPETNALQRINLVVESTDKKANQSVELMKRCQNKPTPSAPCAD